MIDTVDYEKLRETFLEFINRQSCVPTFAREKLADQLVGLVKDQLEPKAQKEEVAS